MKELYLEKGVYRYKITGGRITSAWMDFTGLSSTAVRVDWSTPTPLTSTGRLR